MKRILIEIATGRLCDIVAIGAEFPVAAGLQWVDAPDDVSSETHMFSGGVVNIKPAKPLAQLRTEKLASLEASRKQAIDTLPPITVAAKQYPATPEYREVITGIARRQAAGRPVPGTLRGADGVPVTLTPVLIGQIDDAIAAAVEAQWTRYWSRYDAVQVAATVAAIELVVW